MHDLVLALSFVAMLVAPALVAAMSGKRASEPSEVAAEMLEHVIAAPVIAQRMRAMPVVATVNYGAVPTLPMYRTRSLGGR
jgi:hypothetical protein